MLDGFSVFGKFDTSDEVCRGEVGSSVFDDQD